MSGFNCSTHQQGQHCTDDKDHQNIGQERRSRVGALGRADSVGIEKGGFVTESNTRAGEHAAGCGAVIELGPSSVDTIPPIAGLLHELLLVRRRLRADSGNKKLGCIEYHSLSTDLFRLHLLGLGTRRGRTRPTLRTHLSFGFLLLFPCFSFIPSFVHCKYFLCFSFVPSFVYCKYFLCLFFVLSFVYPFFWRKCPTMTTERRGSRKSVGRVWGLGIPVNTTAAVMAIRAACSRIPNKRPSGTKTPTVHEHSTAAAMMFRTWLASRIAGCSHPRHFLSSANSASCIDASAAFHRFRGNLVAPRNILRRCFECKGCGEKRGSLLIFLYGITNYTWFMPEPLAVMPICLICASHSEGF